jgi:hypothetical protein
LAEVESACQDLDLPTPALHQRRPDPPSTSAVQKPSFSTVATSVAPSAPKQAIVAKPAARPPQVPSSTAKQPESNGGWARSGAEPTGSWGAQRPSLLKRWFGFADDDREEDELSLKRHL